MQGARFRRQGGNIRSVPALEASRVVAQDDTTTQATDISNLLFVFLFRYILCRVELPTTHTVAKR
jgi:hypothetical protein